MICGMTSSAVSPVKFKKRSAGKAPPSASRSLPLQTIRTGFITTKRSGKAHDRSLLRRRFRSLVQSHAPQFAELRRFLVTIARPGAITATFAELEEDWVRQAKRLGLFQRPESIN